MRIVTFRVFVKRSRSGFLGTFRLFQRTTRSLHDARGSLCGRRRGERRATFPRFMPLAPPAARLSRACEPLDARDHPSVTRWLSRRIGLRRGRSRFARRDLHEPAVRAPRTRRGGRRGAERRRSAPNGAPRSRTAPRVALGKAKARAKPKPNRPGRRARRTREPFPRWRTPFRQPAKRRREACRSRRKKKWLEKRTQRSGGSARHRRRRRVAQAVPRASSRMVATVVVARARARVAARARASARGAERRRPKPFLYGSDD